jgi:CRP-like cAMP-binding protein
LRQPSSKPVGNALLAAMSAKDLRLLRPHLRPIEFQVRDVFFAADKPIRRVYFPESGIASVVATAPSGVALEVGLIGRDGMVGVPIVLGEKRSPYESYAQVAGRGYAMSSAALWKAMERSGTLADLMLKYVYAFLIQVTHSALANGRYTIEQRLARWLLMAHDRVEADVVPLTHEFLSMMLGVRRAGVTVAMNALARRGAVRARPGRVTVRDRRKLERIAGACYGVPESELAHVGLGDIRRKRRARPKKAASKPGSR